MQRKDNKTELLRTVSQLIPSPDESGVGRQIEAATERERVDRLLESGSEGAFFVKYELRKCIVPDLSFLRTAPEDEKLLFVTTLLPFVRVCLYQAPLSKVRLVSEEDEALFRGFLHKIGYKEDTIPPQNKYDKIETLLFSLPNEGRADS